jgi:uncharacterized protein YigE (DUF2233 family)
MPGAAPMMRRRPSYQHHWLLALLLVIAGALSACTGDDAPPPATRVVPTLLPTAQTGAAEPINPPAGGSAAAEQDSGWIAGASGLELRRLQVSPGDERPPFPVVVTRLDPAQVRLRVLYNPEEPRPISAWFAERRPLLAVNGGFFTEQYMTTALLISDGVASGDSYQGFGGMFAVSPAESIALWPLRDAPYDPAVPLAQGVQSFPMLVFPGGEPAPVEDNGQRARRTAVALDTSGRLLFVVSPTSGFTLRELAHWLAEADLEVDRALNLDGGSSTGLYIDAGGLSEQIDSFGPLPIVILAEARS